MSFMKVFLLMHCVVIAHEIGHYAAARLIGVRVKEVCFGKGIWLWSWTDRKTKTVFTIRFFPVSGYNRMKTVSGSRRRRAERMTLFENRSFKQRVFVLLAGSGANVCCALLIWCILSVWHGCEYAYELRYAMNLFFWTAYINLIPLQNSDGERVFSLVMDEILILWERRMAKHT